MAALTDGTQAGTITAPAGISTDAPVAGAGTPLTGQDNTAKISVPNVGASLPNPATPATAFSSEAGAAALADSSATAAKLSSAPAAPTAAYTYDANGRLVANTNASAGTSGSSAPSATGPVDPSFAAGGTNNPTTTPVTSSVSLVNKDTGQEYTINNPTADQIATFKSNGWDIAEGTGDGTGVVPTDPGTAAAQAAVTQAKSDRDAAVAKLNNFDVSNDPALTSILNSITSDWDARIAQMNTVNNSRVANTTTLGIRLGDQYTGGTAGAFGGIISSEEQAGVQRIADLESQKQQALAAATTAYSNQQWDRYSKLVDVADSTYTEQVDQLNKLQTAAAAQTKALNDAAEQEKTDTYNQVTKPINDIASDVLKNTGDAKLAQSVASAPDVATAMALAGDAVQTGTGVVGEYLYYKRQAIAAGQQPVDFNTYQTVDANRKAKADASASGANGAVDITSFDSKTQSALTNNGFTNYSGGTQSLAAQLVNGQIAPSELSKRTTGTASYNDVLNAADAYSMATTGKHFNVAQADRDYKFANNKTTQDTLNYLGSLVGSDDGSGNITGGNLDDLVTLSNGITRTSFPAINDIAAWTRYSTGDPNIAAFQATATEVADQVAKILQGGGGGGTSDAKLQQAANLFNTGFTKDQLIATVNALKPLLANRAKSMIGDNAYLSDYADQFGIEQDLPGGVPPTTSQTLIQQGASDPIGIGPAPGSDSTSNPLGI